MKKKEEEEEEEEDDEEGGKFPKTKLLKGSWQSKLHKWTKQKKKGGSFYIEEQKMVLVLVYLDQNVQHKVQQ